MRSVDFKIVKRIYEHSLKTGRKAHTIDLKAKRYNSDLLPPKDKIREMRKFLSSPMLP